MSKENEGEDKKTIKIPKWQDPITIWDVLSAGIPKNEELGFSIAGDDPVLGFRSVERKDMTDKERLDAVLKLVNSTHSDIDILYRYAMRKSDWSCNGVFSSKEATRETGIDISDSANLILAIIEDYFNIPKEHRKF